VLAANVGLTGLKKGAGRRADGQGRVLAYCPRRMLYEARAIRRFGVKPTDTIVFVVEP